MKQVLCPCGSGKAFSDCCGRFLDGDEKPRTPEQLMRSRYTAHALGGYGDYLVRTWLTAVELGYTAADFNKDMEQKVQWQKLEIIKASQQGNLGQVEFKAYFLPLSFVKGEGRGEDLQNKGRGEDLQNKRRGEDLQNKSRGEDLQIHHEKSLFKRIDGLWYYVEAL